jgi:hypothetical protein
VGGSVDFETLSNDGGAGHKLVAGASFCVKTVGEESLALNANSKRPLAPNGAARSVSQCITLSTVLSGIAWVLNTCVNNSVTLWIALANVLTSRADLKPPVCKPSKHGVQTIEERCVNHRSSAAVCDLSKPGSGG